MGSPWGGPLEIGKAIAAAGLSLSGPGRPRNAPPRGMPGIVGGGN